MTGAAAVELGDSEKNTPPSSSSSLSHAPLRRGVLTWQADGGGISSASPVRAGAPSQGALHAGTSTLCPSSAVAWRGARGVWQGHSPNSSGGAAVMLAPRGDTGCNRAGDSEHDEAGGEAGGGGGAVLGGGGSAGVVPALIAGASRGGKINVGGAMMEGVKAGPSGGWVGGVPGGKWRNNGATAVGAGVLMENPLSTEASALTGVGSTG